ncbi:MAG: phosphoribosylglycinamide formyltransferase [Lewinellaceae bacterium]|jgi:phosphoribosylglycinamide formyltransferase-1|nr:phosphoribosylglycinamide formyltransferase [Lewinellaceae bacterium]
MKNFAVFVSGYGRGAMEIIKDWKRGLVKPNLRLLLSSSPDAACLEFARENGLETAVAERKKGESKAAFETRLLETLRPYSIDYIYLAGWMHILGPTLLSAYPGKVVNVHPSLLPSFKGLNGIQQAMEYGVKLTGVTTHFVDETIDGGKIIAQKCIEIKTGDTFDDIDNRLFKITTLITLDTINEIFK